MKSFFIKISALFFLSILLASNVATLHIYIHDEAQSLSHHENDLGCNDGNDEDTPCDICVIAFNINNLNYSYTPQFSFTPKDIAVKIASKKTFGYVNILQKQLYLNKNRNKAPPQLA